MIGVGIESKSALRIGITVGLLTMMLPSTTTNAGSVSAGRPMYQTHCEICHGQDGQPVMAGAPDFTRGDGLFQSDAAVFDAIRSSEIMMHGFEGILLDQEIIDIITYIRTLY